MSSETKYHFFWRKGSPFSQWHPSRYNLDGHEYSSAEQGMMHGKALLFGDQDAASRIMETDDPRTIKALGREVAGFSEKRWKNNRETIVYRNNLAKFTQNGHLLEALMGTTGLLVEASPGDKIWGIGMHEEKARRTPANQWKGSNLLGKILTRVRQDIRDSSDPCEEGDTSSTLVSEEKCLPAGVKTVYMVRHGQSEGQVATRRERKNSAALLDCDLTRKGRQQAGAVAARFADAGGDFDSVEIVVSSPLTRALHTSLLAFPRKDIIVHYGLCEIGTGIPENIPRSMDAVRKSLRRALDARDGGGGAELDTDSLQPADWPNRCKDIGDDQLQEFIQWLAKERSESVIAVVCHYNVIRGAVEGGKSLSPENATPICCRLYPNGKLVLAE